MRVGRTIAEERERIESESDRLAARERKKNREALQVAILVVAAISLVVLGVISAKNLARRSPSEQASESVATFSPTVPIRDESGAGLTKKMNEFIGMVEADFRETEFEVTQVVVPAGLLREVDVYVKRGGEVAPDSAEASNSEAVSSSEAASKKTTVALPYYFKMNIDRGSAVSVEDAVRMIKYLETHEVVPAYVDVRVEGKAFYR